MYTEPRQTDHLQISFSPTDQDRRYAGKRLLRYIEPDWRRKYWFGSAAFLLMWGILFVFACWLFNGINNTYVQNCYLFADSQTDSLEYCLYKARDDSSSLWIMAGLIYATSMVMYFDQRWTYRSFARRAAHPLEGRRFSLSLSAEGLTQEEAGRNRHFHHWAGVERIIEDQAFLLFYIDRNIAYFIPIAAFAEAGMDAHAFYTRAMELKAAAEATNPDEIKAT
ncbi:MULTISPECIES: YcxB family protein [Neisseria]|uniref:YcxB family protein n=1 Tax=Neisseria TaxID=482 RepID=UPI0006655D9E|nr:YcxB family protein [Neisseria sicca]